MMKRNLIVFGVFAFLCFAGSAYAAINVKCNENRITISETKQAGDAAAAEGLVISFDSCLYDRDTTKGEMSPDKYASGNVITFTGKEPENEYIRFPADDDFFTKQESWYYEDAQARQINNYNGYIYGIRNWVSSSVYYENVIFASEDFQERWKAAGQPGEIRISDYYEYYPSVVEGIAAEIGTGWYKYSFAISGRWLGDPLPISAEEASDALKTCSDFLKIPVLPDDKWELVYDLNSSRWTRIGESYYRPEFYKVWKDGVFYFTFDTEAEDGSIVDTSQIPGGFGIYRVPIHTSVRDGVTAETFGVDEMKLFCPLDPEQKIIRLGLSGNGECIYLIYRADGVIRAKMIDAETGEILADVLLGDADVLGGKSSFVAFNGEDYYVLEAVKSEREAENSEIFVLGKKSDGKWGIRMHTTAYASRNWKDGTSAFDGERLALLEYSDRYFKVIVYSEAGELYRGVITASLFLSNDEIDWGAISGVKCQWK